jgi:hypothetical protein
LTRPFNILFGAKNVIMRIRQVTGTIIFHGTARCSANPIYNAKRAFEPETKLVLPGCSKKRGMASGWNQPCTVAARRDTGTRSTSADSTWSPVSSTRSVRWNLQEFKTSSLYRFFPLSTYVDAPVQHCSNSKYC